MFDSTSSTNCYVLASRRGGEALVINPVLEKVDRYVKLMEELDLRLVKAVDTHLHADHVIGLGALRDRTQCITVMGEQSEVDVVSIRIAQGDTLAIEGLGLDVLYTPGHTDGSYSFLCGDRVFTGDTLLIRGTGRADFQNGDLREQYESLQRLSSIAPSASARPWRYKASCTGRRRIRGRRPELYGLLTQPMGYELGAREARFSTAPTQIRPQTEKTQLA